tara:strand:- start:325 stop:438 length:114 start_codon:yes stop_codon:yes gene_type:complete
MTSSARIFSLIGTIFFLGAAMRTPASLCEAKNITLMG